MKVEEVAWGEEKKRGFELARPPQDDDELHALVQLLWGVNLPRKQVCPNHVAPFTAFADAYFSRDPNYAVWYGSRGTGKSLMLAILALTKSILLDVDVTLLGGSMAQSANVHEHNRNLLRFKRAPDWALKKNIASEIITNADCYIRPLPASQTTVRGPHPNTTLLDEVDEMEWDIYNAAQGQALEQPNAKGVDIPEYVVASSTWQNVDGTFTKVLGDAKKAGNPVYTWCWREVVKPHGWMNPDFVERKRRNVPAEMFRVEYELGEPSGETSAFDVTKIQPYFIEMTPIDERKADSDHEIVYEEFLPTGEYKSGADWGKQKDFTVFTVFRTDVMPHRVVYWRKWNRRDWPTMISAFDELNSRYQATSAHDATGMGSVIADLIDERSIKVEMVKSKRTPLITEYIVAVEQGQYLLPVHLFEAHKATTVDAVYSGGASGGGHLRDEIVSLAMAHRAATRVPGPASAIGVKKDGTPPKWMIPILGTPNYTTEVVSRREGEVTVVEQRSDVGVFWL